MLDKLRVTMIVGLALGLVRVFLPDFQVPEDFQTVVSAVINGVFVIIAVVAGYFKRENQAKVNDLDTV